MTSPGVDPSAEPEPSAEPDPLAEPDPFREYHRAENRSRITRVVVGVAVAVGVIGGVSALGAAAPPSPAPISAGSGAEHSDSSAAQSTADGTDDASDPAGAGAETPTVLPSPAASPGTPTPAPTPTGAAGARVWTIAIDTRGYQAEIDQCLWVRMDLGAAAPLVGAHNYCGGGIVLEMAIGDTVLLTGQDLDGTYRVTEERLARAGDPAAGATEGLTAAVILQTCFWEDDGRERLLALVAVG